MPSFEQSSGNDVDDAKKPTRAHRALVACSVGIVGALLAMHFQWSGQSNFSDFDQIWMGARALARGKNAYAVVVQGFKWPLYYPLPAAIIGMPFEFFSRLVATALWVGLGFSLLAYALTAVAWWPLIGLASFPALDAAHNAQWSPIITAAALLPSLAWIAIAKPTTGLAVVGAYFRRSIAPLRWNAAIAAAIVALSFALDPSWPREWLEAVSAARHFVPLVLRPWGALVLVVLLRWRRPEARLVALMALIPQTLAGYDALPLVLVASTRREALVFAWLSWLSLPFLTHRAGTGAEFTNAIARDAPVFLLTLYLPAVIMILRRTNQAPSEDIPGGRDRVEELTSRARLQ